MNKNKYALFVDLLLVHLIYNKHYLLGTLLETV